MDSLAKKKQERRAQPDASISFKTKYEDQLDKVTEKNGRTAKKGRSHGHDEFAEESIFWWQSHTMEYSQNGFSWQLSN